MKPIPLTPPQSPVAVQTTPVTSSTVLNGHVEVEDVSVHTTVTTSSGEASPSKYNDGEDDSVTRCICDFTHDDGYMICCDRCR